MARRARQAREVFHPRILAKFIKPFDPNRSFLRSLLEESPGKLLRRVVRGPRVRAP